MSAHTAPSTNPYREGLDRNPANFTALSPVSLFNWVVDVYPDHPGLIHGQGASAIRRSWRELGERARRLASVLAKMGVGDGDTVSTILPNIPAMVDLHYAVPMSGAVLNTINMRLDAGTIAYILEHSGAKVVVVDREFSPVAKAALAQMPADAPRPFVVDVDDPLYDGPGERIGDVDYEAWLAQGDPAFRGSLPADEWDAIALNYTSGTTGRPKGVVVHHRGAYLNAVGNVLSWGMPHHPIYLWTLPMFHCNGWCYPWTIAAVAGTHVCLRKVDPALIFALMREHKVSHYCGAPIVHNLLISAPAALREGIDHEVRCMVAGAAPPASMIEGMAKMGFKVTHVYGLTEVYGPASVCAQHPDWADLPLDQQVKLNGRQGVRYQVQEALTVIDTQTGQEVPRDGETMGEVVFRGNVVMKGYLKNPTATSEAFAGGWFHTGDLGVLYPDGYVKLKDRAKDIIISGGENISSIEVEDVIYQHPAVLACAVVPKPDPKWGETPLAFIELKPGAEATAEELLAHCKARLAGYMCPREVQFTELPKTSTGKIQKHELRARVKSAAAIG